MKFIRRLTTALSWRLYTGLRWILTPVILIRCLICVWRERAKLAVADVIVVCEAGGFGYQATAPDIIRRLYPDLNSVLLFATVPGIHNLKYQFLWRNPLVILLPMGIQIAKHQPFSSIRPYFNVQQWFGGWLGKFLARTWPSKKVLPELAALHECLWNASSAMPGVSIDDARREENSGWLIPYYYLCRQRPAEPVKLPQSLRGEVNHALDSALESQITRRRELCCLYLRFKGNDSEVTSSSRSGSEISEYVPAFRFLTQCGYQCLVIGDRLLPTETFIKFRGWVVDAAHLGLDRDIFALFGATEAEIFIGEPGGGGLMPGLNNIPHLTVNQFPYYASRHQETMFYKFCTDATGRRIDLMTMFTCYSRAHEIPGGRVLANTASELEAAIRDFVQGHRVGKPYGIDVGTLPNIPDDIWHRESQARISPAWLRLIENNETGKIAAPNSSATKQQGAVCPESGASIDIRP